MKRHKIHSLFVLAVSYAVLAQAQSSDPMLYQRWNIIDINRVRTQFNNTGELCDGNEQNVPLARPPAFEYPNGSGMNYGTCVAIVVGAPGTQDSGAVGGSNPTKLEYADGAMNEGPAAFWDPEHYAPYPELVNGAKAPLSTDTLTWPKSGPNRGWPASIPGTNLPLKVGAEGWPGLGPNGERLADQETYSVMYAWKGRKEGGQNRRWLQTQVEMRGMAWTGELYQDFIVWHYVVRNIGTAPIRGIRIGVHSDFGYFPVFQNMSAFDADRHYYDRTLQLAYGTDDNGFEITPTGQTLGAKDIAWSGTIALQMPGPSRKVKTYDAFHFWMDATTAKGNGASMELYFRYNLANQNDPRDSDHDGIDDDFDGDGVADWVNGGLGYYLGEGSDGLQAMGSDSLTLFPGQSDTLVFATVFGMTKAQLLTNTQRALTLFRANWKTVKAPPAPRVEVIPGDRKMTILWNTESEREKKFEGYKIYRSVDAGVTWGSETFTDFGGTIHYIPLAQYDKVDSILGHYRTLPEYTWYNLGNETGLPVIRVIDVDTLSVFHRGDTVRVFIDDKVTNGLRYRYYVAAYDTGNGIIGPLENTPATVPAQGTNCVEVVPRSSVSTGSLSAVRVVPNPYLVSSGWEIGLEHQLQFTHMPSRATIRIFNVAGELVRTLEHDAGQALAPSIAVWDLKNEDRQLVAAGLYFYHIDSSIGSTQGKFIVIQ